MSQTVIVIGLGEVGKPLLDLISKKYRTIGVDVIPIETDKACDIMHICYPFDIDDFIGATVQYIEKYDPLLTIINSTVAPGTTREIYNIVGKPIVHSPIRGKHVKMKDELLHYTKFIGGINEEAGLHASEHFKSLGMKTKLLPLPEATELAKLTETSYFGLLIAWAQEVERYCRELDLDYDQIVSFYEEIHFFPPVKYTPGVIGGHCLIPHIEILKTLFKSDILEAIQKSNEMKIQKIGLKDLKMEDG